MEQLLETWRCLAATLSSETPVARIGSPSPAGTPCLLDADSSLSNSQNKRRHIIQGGTKKKACLYDELEAEEDDDEEEEVGQEMNEDEEIAESVDGVHEDEDAEEAVDEEHEEEHEDDYEDDEAVQVVDEVKEEEEAAEALDEDVGVEVAGVAEEEAATTPTNGEVIVRVVDGIVFVSQIPAASNRDLQRLFDARNEKDFRALVSSRTGINLSQKIGMSKMSKERLVVEKALDLLKPTPANATDPYDMYTRDYLRMSCKFYEAIGNPQKLKEFAEGREHLICLACPGNKFNLHSNPNGYVCYGGQTSTHQHDHTESLHALVLAAVKAKRVQIVPKPNLKPY